MINIQQENQKVNRVVGSEAEPLGNVGNGVSEGLFCVASMMACGLSSFPVGGQAATLPAPPTDGVGKGAGRVDCLYRINRSDRLRVPGDDDGADLSAGSPAWFDDDPFEGVGAQLELAEFLEDPPYLDLYGWNRGVGKKDDFREDEDGEKKSERLTVEEAYKRDLNRFRACGKTAALMSTADFEDFIHRVNCWKHWCPRCGGKNGIIHKARKQAVHRRVDLEMVNIRQAIFTVPDRYREKFHSKKGLNQLVQAAKRIKEKYYGKEKGAIAYIHVYGDKDLSVWNPHINIHVIEDLSVKLKESPERLAAICESWRRALIGMGCVGCEVVDFNYSFKVSKIKKLHAVKYMSRPTWNGETLDLVDEVDRLVLVLGLKGFQYIRFWGELSNRRYREGAVHEIREAKKDFENLIGKRLFFRTIVSCNIEEMLKQGHIEEVGAGFYRILKRGFLSSEGG